MESCDSLLTYEIRNREIENLCLIKRELEHRGYKVLVREQYAPFFKVPEPIDAKVVVVPAYYRERARFYTASHVNRATRVVNLQWEQMLSNTRSGSKDALCAIKPWGYGAMHISWGEDDRNRLVEVYGVPESHIALTGHIGMDFLRPQLRDYYLSRDEVCSRYDLPADKEISLFISSFAVATMHERFFESASVSEDEKQKMYRHREVSLESQRMILEWFDRLLSENDDRILVYRPHPEEKDSEILRRMVERHPNFRVISDMSVKQWILVSDKIFTWASTSVVEVFFAEKTCLILNPLPLPEQMKMQLYENASVVTSCDDFLDAARSETPTFPIPEDDIGKFYYVDRGRLSHELVCDALERALTDDEFELDAPLENPFRGVLNIERIQCWIKRRVAASRICRKIHDGDKLRGSTLRKNIDDVIYVKEKLAKNHVSDAEISEIISRIDASSAVRREQCE